MNLYDVSQAAIELTAKVPDGLVQRVMVLVNYIAAQDRLLTKARLVASAAENFIRKPTHEADAMLARARLEQAVGLPPYEAPVKPVERIVHLASEIALLAQAEQYKTEARPVDLRVILHDALVRERYKPGSVRWKAREEALAEIDLALAEAERKAGIR